MHAIDRCVCLLDADRLNRCSLAICGETLLSILSDALRSYCGERFKPVTLERRDAAMDLLNARKRFIQPRVEQCKPLRHRHHTLFHPTPASHPRVAKW